MNTYKDNTFDCERALYGLENIRVVNCKFSGPSDGESAIKECRNVEVEQSYFDLRYPFWHLTNGKISDSSMTENCRAAFWYDINVEIEKCNMNGVKALRECNGLKINKCKISSSELLWKCNDIEISDSEITSEYAFLECRNVKINKLKMMAKYSFQYVSSMEISDSVLDTKDAFWHSKDVTVKNSIVNGEYLGWYSENLKLINCKITGIQPLCYCKGLVLENCTMERTDLAFERSEVNAKVIGNIESIKNPKCGKIICNSISQMIFEPEYCDRTRTEIVTLGTSDIFNK